MEKLKDNITSSLALSKALKKNGILHIRYKMYTSMERALSLLVSGHLYLSDGSTWNDISDRETMKAKGVYARSFSYSTSESVAMWMLYGDENGKKGAMLNFRRSEIKEILEAYSIEIGKFAADGIFQPYDSLERNIDYELFITDMLYAEECNNGKVKLTLAEDHATTDASVLDDPDIFYKKYPWAYERECRIVVKIKDKWKKKAMHESLNCIRITISEKLLRSLRKDRLVRSPIYKGGVDNGLPSLLTGDIEWNIGARQSND